MTSLILTEAQALCIFAQIEGHLETNEDIGLERLVESMDRQIAAAPQTGTYRLLLSESDAAKVAAFARASEFRGSDFS